MDLHNPSLLAITADSGYSFTFPRQSSAQQSLSSVFLECAGFVCEFFISTARRRVSSELSPGSVQITLRRGPRTPAPVVRVSDFSRLGIILPTALQFDCAFPMNHDKGSHNNDVLADDEHTVALWYRVRPISFPYLYFKQNWPISRQVWRDSSNFLVARCTVCDSRKRRHPTRVYVLISWRGGTCLYNSLAAPLW